MISALDINYFAGVPRLVALREGPRQQHWVGNPPLGGRREGCDCENSRGVRRRGRARSGGCADFSFEAWSIARWAPQLPNSPSSRRMMEHEKMSGCLMPAFSERFWIYSLSLSSVTVSSKLPTYSTAFLPVGFFLVTRDQRLSSSSSASGCTCSVGAMVSPVSFCSAVDSCGRAVVCERSE